MVYTLQTRIRSNLCFLNRCGLDAGFFFVVQALWLLLNCDSGSVTRRSPWIIGSASFTTGPLGVPFKKSPQQKGKAVQTKNPKGMSRMSKAAAAAEEQHRKQKNPKKRAKSQESDPEAQPSAHKKPTVLGQS